MRLIDLDPKWLVRDGKRMGFIFRNPVRGQRGWWTSCFFQPTPEADQESLIEALIGDAPYQGCNPKSGWRVVGAPIDQATFETITIEPSLDGGPNFWHGHIKNGQIVGGI